MADTKAPLIHLVKRGDVSKTANIAIRIGAFVAAIVISGLIFLCLGCNPVTAYGDILQGALGKKVSLRQTFKLAVPLLGTAVAITPCFKMKFWNIGAEGQITAGAIGATFFAINFQNSMPHVPLLILMAVGGALGGALWALLPAVFKARWGTNETLFTLMMNYISIGIVRWLKGGPWEGMPGSQIIPNFKDTAILPKLFGVHIGWIMVLVITLFMYFYMHYSKHGYELEVVGESHNTARYAGMSVEKITVRTMLLSGAICGLVGYMVVSGANMTLHDTVANGVGFTAITVSWLSNLNPFVMILISFILAMLSKGSSNLQTTMAIPASVSDIITGIFLFCMLASGFFVQYRVIVRGHKKEAAKA